MTDLDILINSSPWNTDSKVIALSVLCIVFTIGFISLIFILKRKAKV